MLVFASLSWAACAGALVLPLRALAGTRGCCQMTAEGTEQAKATLISALAELRKAPSPGAQRAVLSATSQLEARGDPISASADGRWALLFSTQGAPEVGQPAGTIPLVQPLIDATYAAFFKIAPALAGAQQDGAAERFNEQRVSLAAGVVENRVRVRACRCPRACPLARRSRYASMDSSHLFRREARSSAWSSLSAPSACCQKAKAAAAAAARAVWWCRCRGRWDRCAPRFATRRCASQGAGEAAFLC